MTASSNMWKQSTTGEGPISPLQGIYEQSETAKAVLGTRLKVGDRVFHYARAHSATFPVGALGVSNSVSVETDTSIATTVAAGVYEVTIATAAAQTEVEEGYLAVIDGTGQGYIYKIRESKANATTSTYTDLILYDPISTALTSGAASQVAIHPSPYNDIRTATATTDPVMGVAPIAITAHYYFWLQTWGPAPLLSSAATVVGSIVVSTNAGAGVIQTAYTGPIVGTQYLVGAIGDYRTVWLRINP